MKIRKTHAAWAVKAWVLGSVFVVPFIGPWTILAWLGLGAAFGLTWQRLPDEPEAPVEPLPFQDRYRGREIPRQDR